MLLLELAFVDTAVELWKEGGKVGGWVKEEGGGGSACGRESESRRVRVCRESERQSAEWQREGEKG